MANSLTISDPSTAPLVQGSLWARWWLPLLNDQRDLPFVTLSATITAVLVPAALLLYWPGVFRWYWGVVYLAANFILFVDRYILMLHNVSHRGLFKQGYRALDKYIPWVLGPLCGETPETYYVHHMGMHHAEGNMPTDLSSTMRYQRDSFLHWLQYFVRFLFCHPALWRYLTAKKRLKLRRRFFWGEGLWLVAVAGLAAVNPGATLFVFVLPVLIVRVLMMAGNWGQHAFVAPEDPSNDYRNSITCINSRYNRRCFNDGYHIGHHLRAHRHWTELPGDFLANRDRYRENDAIVFHSIDFFMVWLYLMRKRHDLLAEKFVELREQPRSKEEIITLLKSRLERHASRRTKPSEGSAIIG